jgi:hypothetical protein
MNRVAACHVPWGFLLALGLGCGEATPDCTAPTDTPTRDRCTFEAVTTAAEQARTADAVALVYTIEDPLLRGAAIQRLVALHPPGLDTDTMNTLCATLPEIPSQRCSSQWNRPHLWQQPQ